ncbi:MAG: HEPN domain-containing protein [Patescibacteria group bacterium]|nr:HEPN domain-containing protein [Patescibacteria group bacterium]MCL5095644.1 HEPN domain-containing protein [Patescibacteria group bacterium]
MVKQSFSVKKKFRESKYYEDWLLKARRDLDTGFLNNRHGGYTDTTCYFCHQATEKALKAYLLAKGLEFLPKIHILPLLLTMCVDKDRDFLQFEKQCKILNEYFIETKYPADAIIDYSKEETEQALFDAEELFYFIEKKLKQT